MNRAILYGLAIGSAALAGFTNLASGQAQDGLQWLSIGVLAGFVTAIAIGDIKIYKL